MSIAHERQWSTIRITQDQTKRNISLICKSYSTIQTKGKSQVKTYFILTHDPLPKEKEKYSLKMRWKWKDNSEQNDQDDSNDYNKFCDESPKMGFPSGVIGIYWKPSSVGNIPIGKLNITSIIVFWRSSGISLTWANLNWRLSDPFGLPYRFSFLHFWYNVFFFKETNHLNWSILSNGLIQLMYWSIFIRFFLK